jgi:EmrB/QacA subfamily drug resistance transporter
MESAPMTAEAGGQPIARLGHRERLEVLGAILLGLLLGALDQTIVGVALPSIVTDLHGTSLYTWTVTIYLLTSTISVPFWGKLSDIYGRKVMLMLGIAIFLVGSALCGLSQEMWQLILFRGIQGIGAGSLFPIALAVIGDLFTPAERGKYQGIFAAVFGFAALVGPALGGFLTDTVSWHAIFYINIPVGLISLFVIWRIMPPLKREGLHHSLDIVGAVLFTAAVAPFLIGLTNAQDNDWATPQVGGLVALGLAVFGVFLLFERRAPEPIIPLHLFRGRTYSASIAATFLSSLGFFAAIVFLPLYFQVVQGASATESGYLSFPLLIGVMAGSIGSGQIIARTGKYKTLILGSLFLVGVGSFLMTNLRADTDYLVLSAWMLILGLGVGPTLAAFTIVIQNAVPIHELGAATSSLTFFRQIGGSIGLAVAGSFFGSRIVTNLTHELSGLGLPPELTAGMAGGFDRNDLGAGVDLAGVLAAAGVPAQFIDTIVGAVHSAMSVTIGEVFWLGVGASALAFVVSLLIAELPLRESAGFHAPAVARSDGPATVTATAEAKPVPE